MSWIVVTAVGSDTALGVLAYITPIELRYDVSTVKRDNEQISPYQQNVRVGCKGP